MYSGTSSSESDLEKDRRRRFRIRKSGDRRISVEAEPSRGELKKRVKAELRKMSPEERRELHERLNPDVSRLEKADDSEVRRGYNGRPVLIGDGRGGERRVGDDELAKTEPTSTENQARLMRSIVDQPASLPDGTTQRL